MKRSIFPLFALALSLSWPALALPKQLPQARQAKLEDFAERPVDMARWQGKVLVVNFWGSWCGYCVKELPDLVATQKKWERYGVQVVSLAFNDDAETIAQVSRRYRINYPVLNGDKADKNWRRSMGIAAANSRVPLTWVIDADNTVLLRQLGGVTAKELDAALADSVAAKQMPEK